MQKTLNTILNIASKYYKTHLEITQIVLWRLYKNIKIYKSQPL